MSRKVVIIGAGAAGLTCAKKLLENGFKVSIFDKSRGVGGRLASRRIENGIFNHGASRIPDFRSYNNIPKSLKCVLETAAQKKIIIPQDNHFTAFASMKTFTGYLSRDIAIQKNKEIVAANKVSSGVELLLNDNSKLQLNNDFLVFAIPQPQVLNLLHNHFPEILNLVQSAEMYGSISGLFAFNEPIAFNKPFFENDHIFGFHENSRKGQNLKLDCWTIHSKKSYGKKFMHFNKDQIGARLFTDFEHLTSSNLPQPIYSEGHRWLYGFTEKALNKNYIFHQQNKIGICGDWCLGDNVLDATISGTLLAEKIVASDIE